jgi:RNA polymerase sigma factor (sigma-70 family)
MEKRDMIDDAELLRRYVEHHSEPAFSELVQRKAGVVYHGALRRTGGRADLATEVSQYVFTTLARNAQSLLDHATLAGWLHTTTRLGAYRILRAERRRLRRETEFARMNDSTAPETPAEWHRLRPELDGLMDQLSHREREAVLLRYYHGQPFGQIGAVLGLNEEAARKRVDRALERLRALLAKRGFTSSATALAALLTSEAGLAAPAGLAQSLASTALLPGAVGLPTLGAGPVAGAVSAVFGGAGALTVAAVLVIAAFGTSTYAFREARSNSAMLDTARHAYGLRRSHLAYLENQARSADERLAATRRELETARSAALAAPAPAHDAIATASTKTRDPRADGAKFLATFSEARSLLRDVGKAQSRSALAGFFRAAGLTSSQMEEFEARVAEYALENIALAPGSITPLATQLPDEQVRQILGEAGPRVYQEFMRMAPARAMATQVATAVGYTASPLSLEQREMLGRILTDGGLSSGIQTGMGMISVDWSSVKAQARTILTPEQWQAGEGVFLEREYLQALDEAGRRAVAVDPNESQPPASPSP